MRTHIALHLYTVHPCTCSLRSLSRARSARCGRRTSGPIASSRSPSVLLAPLFTSSGRSPFLLAVRAARCAVHLLAYVLYRLGDCYIFNDTSPGLFFTCARCACLCVRLLMPGQRWTFLSAVPVWPALLARFPCACGRARVRGRCPPTFQSLAVHFIRL